MRQTGLVLSELFPKMPVPSKKPQLQPVSLSRPIVSCRQSPRVPYCVRPQRHDASGERLPIGGKRPGARACRGSESRTRSLDYSIAHDLAGHRCSRNHVRSCKGGGFSVEHKIYAGLRGHLKSAPYGLDRHFVRRVGAHSLRFPDAFQFPTGTGGARVHDRRG